MNTAYTIDVLIALADGEQPTRLWWLERYQWGDRRAGGMPPEVADPTVAEVFAQTDPETGEAYACVALPLPPGTGRGRAREIAHMLVSVLAAEGFTLRHCGRRDEALPGAQTGEPEGSLGEVSLAGGRVCSSRCLDCALSTETRLGCCTEGASFTLADMGIALLAGAESFVAQVLALPGEREGDNWQPYLTGGRCVFHAPDRGCTLPPERMPLQCRTYLCLPDQLLPPHLLADYQGYVDALEEEECFVEEHMRHVSGVDFDSPLEAVRVAAAKAVAAWAAERRKAAPLIEPIAPRIRSTR